MYKYELKKVTGRLSTKVTLGVFCVYLIWMLGAFYIRSEVWVNPRGEAERGIHAIHNLKEMKKEWEGPVTEEKIARVLEANARITSDPEYALEGGGLSNTGYAKRQGFADIRDLINQSFCSFRENDYYMADRLGPEDAQQFYVNRTEHLREWLYGEYSSSFSDKEKAYYIQQFEKMEIPLEYRYQTGWSKTIEFTMVVIMGAAIVVCILVASVFPWEYQTGASSVFYSSCYGRSRGIKAKIGAVLTIAAAVYWTAVLVSSGILLAVFGTDGAGCMIQANGFWKSLYNITNLEAYILCILWGFIICLFMSILTAWISAVTGSSILPIVTSFLLIMAPAVVGQYVTGGLAGDILGLLPHQLMQGTTLLRLFTVYTIGGKVVNLCQILPPLYLGLTAVLLPAVYLVYRKKEVY